MSLSPKARKLARIFFILVLSAGILLVAGIGLTYYHQDHLVKDLVANLNYDFKGKLEIEGSHISPFKNFPYISIDLENIKIYESKEDTSEVILSVSDAYVGFDILSLLDGSYEIKRIKLENGFLKLVQHTDETFNIANALTGEPDPEQEEVEGDELHLDLQKIKLVNIDLLKLNEANNILVEAFIWNADAKFKTSGESMDIGLNTDFTFNLIIDSDTSFLHHKTVSLNTSFNLDYERNVLNIDPSELLIESAVFNMEGLIDVDDDMNLDLYFEGSKPDFNLFLAFVPEELSPIVDRYSNGGNIYFDATVVGPSINGNNPDIEIYFGCDEAFVHNDAAGKEVNDLFFTGYFTNGPERNASTMSLSIEDFSARPETGVFYGNLIVENFDSPDINLQLNSDFDLDFLAGFLNMDNIFDVSGGISLEMNFHDIIDLNQPEKSIEKLNESYFTRLIVKDLNFSSYVYPLPVKDVNIRATMDGHRAQIEQLDFKVGSSDLSIKASISDLPAIIHHTDLPVEAVMDINSTLIDLNELTRTKEDSTKGLDEQIRDMSMGFRFKSTARAFTESPNLPLGEFFIERLYADLNHYPHKLHDFNADVYVDSANFRIIDFTGMIDSSDFHFNGKLENYDLWFENKPKGSTQIDFNFTSDLLQLEDLFSYGGENYVPEDYRHEEFRDLMIHGIANLVFDGKLISTDVKMDRIEANMEVHHLRFEQFKGNFFLDSTHMDIKDFGGRLGNSEFSTDLTYYFDSATDQTHEFRLISKHLDFDQLFSYNPPPEGTELTPEDHEAGFNIFELPFSNMNFSMKIDHLNYHRYLLDNFVLDGRMQKDHYLYVDTMAFESAGGRLGLKGYFNGSDPKNIYFSPEIELDKVDLDKLLFKFENFGQDHLVSENLHGELSGKVTGKIHMHADMVPIIDDSELHMDIRVYNGSLNNYSAFELMADYFANKNLKMVRFDTLENQLDLENGKLIIPSMNINTTLGYFELSGEQSTDLDNLEMEYYISIPWKVITRAGFQKLFGDKDQDNTDQIDEIEYRDENKKTRFVNVSVKGTPDDYRIKLGKKKKK